MNVASMVSVVLAEQLAYLRDTGFDVTVVANADPEFESAVRALGLRGIGVRMYRQPRPVHDLRSLYAMTRVMRSQAFDIVHSVEPKAGLLAMLSSAIARVPVRMHTYTGQVWVELSGWWSESARAADRLIGHLATDLLADGRSGAEFLIAKRVVERQKISVLGEGSIAGVELARFSPSPGDAASAHVRSALGIGAADTVILFVGRVVEDKGVVELLDAHDALRAARHDVHLVVVGPLEPERAPLRRNTHDRLLHQRGVHYVGRQDPVPYYRAADLFCLPSYREGFPTVILEAAACGLPTVASRIVGNSDAVIDGMTGVLVPVKDAASLADALATLLEDQGLRHRLGAAARERVRTRFDSAFVNANLVEKYLAALRGRRQVFL